VSGEESKPVQWSYQPYTTDWAGAFLACQKTGSISNNFWKQSGENEEG
jgi:hypothetical protein